MPGERKVGQDHRYYDWSPDHQARAAALAEQRPRGAGRHRQPGALGLAAAGRTAPGAPSRPVPARTSPSFSQHEYGNRVGVFRVLRILDKHGIKPTIAMDKTVAENYPFLVAGVPEAEPRGDRPRHLGPAADPRQDAGRDGARVHPRVDRGRDEGDWEAAGRLAGARSSRSR